MYSTEFCFGWIELVLHSRIRHATITAQLNNASQCHPSQVAYRFDWSRANTSLHFTEMRPFSAFIIHLFHFTKMRAFYCINLFQAENSTSNSSNFTLAEIILSFSEPRGQQFVIK